MIASVFGNLSLYHPSGIGKFNLPRDKVAGVLHQAGSYLTDPICKSHEYFRRIQIVDVLHGSSSSISNLARKVILGVGAVFCALFGSLPAIAGIGARSLAANLQERPYLSSVEKFSSKELPQSKTFPLLSWNVCGIGGGYSISDGGVMPIAFRIDRLANKILEIDADVNCFYEVFDVQTALDLEERLKQKGYTHFYLHFGSEGVGISSGIFVASKYRIASPEFAPFPKEMLVGRAKNARKGVFSFDLESKGTSFARIFATHMQHSETPEFPTQEEMEAREKEMQFIKDRALQIKGRAVLITGDFNLDDREYALSSWKDHFQKRDAYTLKTWGGDGFCARLVGRKASQPLNLDHTMAVKGSVKEIKTTLVETGFDGEEFREEALSDHSGILTQVALK